MSADEVLDLFGALLPKLKINDFPGKLITIDALDGAGNTTQAAKLDTYLKELGIQTVRTKEPVDEGLLGKEIRQFLKKDPTFLAESLRRYPFDFQKMFTVNRGDDLDSLIIPALEFGVWAIADRYSLATLAFGISQGIEGWRLLDINLDYPWPNLNLILSLSVEECLRRVDARLRRSTDQRELFEEQKTLERTWSAYEFLASRLPNTFIVDGSGSEDVVFARVKEVLHRELLDK